MPSEPSGSHVRTGPYDRIVVGAGISGLCAAWWARARGERVLVLEGSGRAGGVIRTDAIRGYRVERAASTLPSSATAALGIAAALSPPVLFRPAAAAAKAQFLWSRAGLRRMPRSPLAMARSTLFGPGALARLLAEAVRGPRRVVRPETLHAFVRRRFGIVPSERLLRPFTSGIYAAAPERLGAADAFPGLLAMERRRGSVLRALASPGAPRTGREVLVPEEGMESLPRALALSLGARLSTPVARLLPREQSVALVDGHGAHHEARRVVLAVPAYEQADLLRPLLPDAAEALEQVRYVPLAVAALGFRRGDGPRVPEGFGFLRLPGAPGRILGATFLSRIDPTVAPEGHELLNVYVGGSEDPSALDLDDERLKDVIVRDVARALEGRVSPDLLDLHRWPRAIPLFSPGHRARMTGLRTKVESLGVVLGGSHLSGVGVHRCAAAGAPPAGVPDGVHVV